MFNFTNFNIPNVPDFIAQNFDFAKSMSELNKLGEQLDNINLDKIGEQFNCHNEPLLLRQHSKTVIEGYLNLGKADGWKEEGGPYSLGVAFTCFIAKQYFAKKVESLGVNKIIFEKVIEGLCEENHLPSKSRVCYDSSVRGWQKHAVSRLVGNVCSAYDPSKPSFEILINSARNSANNEHCQPFFISIHQNGKELEMRRKLLASQEMISGETASFNFYPLSVKKPEDFLKENQERLGPNSTRLLQGLIYLKQVQKDH